jgi:hypothetical protein
MIPTTGPGHGGDATLVGRLCNGSEPRYGGRLALADASAAPGGRWPVLTGERMGEAAAKLTADQPARRGTGKAMTTLADMNHLWPADHNATPWVATRDGSWTRMVGAGVNPEMTRPQKEGRQNAPRDNSSA